MTIDRAMRVPDAARPAAAGGRSRYSRALPAIALAASAILAQGCGDHDLPPGVTKKAVKFDEVPENVRSAAKKAITGIDFNEAWQNLGSEGKVHSYEIRGKNAADGKIREVRVSLTGEILEQE
jgi:hypothetical protein